MKRFLIYLCSLLCVVQFGFGQSEIIAVLDFETPGGYTTTMTPHNNGNSIYFDRSDVTGIGPNYLNLQGNYFFGAQNIDGEPDNPSLLPAFLNIDDINIAGYTNLEFRVYIAEASDGSGEHWENINFPFFNVYNDYMHIDYDVDNSGAFSQLIWVEAAGNVSSSNVEPRIDTDFNGLGDGAEITNAFTQFTQNIPGTGTFLDIQIEFSFDKQYEDIAIDNIEIWGTPTAPPEVDWCNLQWTAPNNPISGETTINFGNVIEFYGQVYENGITDAAGQGTGITAWIGFSLIDSTSENDFTSTEWTWVPANYNSICADCNGNQNDEYFVDIGPYIPASGTYYCVSRFQYNGGPYTYGGYNSGGGGFWDVIDDVSLILTVNSNCSSPQVTWNGTWSGTPDLTTEVVIVTDYDMTGALSSFSACNLVVNPGINLIIGDNEYVEVNNNIINNGNIIVRSKGSVLQHNDNATVSGSAMVEKFTSILNNWYEYTYWSSPVVGETIETALSDSNPNRRFWFNAINFVDAQMETNNDNNLVPGQDDIDDDGNDWLHASGTMTSGIGYAATHSEIAFIGAGNSYKYTFNGPFNNGVVSVPVVRNDAEMNDLNWNFLGNPYPSAIDVDLFFTKNNYDALLNPAGTLEGAIYLWSQNTQPSDINNGNEGQNFSNSDYAIINGIGVIPAEDPGGDGLTPNRYIPSGQGFFSVYSDNVPTTSGNVIFNNSMRVTGNNDQFFRANNSAQSNKLSIKLTSDNGIFNQVLIGYVDGATNSYDGMFYDAPRNLSTGTSAIIYSTIEGNSRKFAIQGKNPDSLNENEVISLGFKNTIEVDTQFMFSIANLEGEFMNSHSIYLKDNLLNIEHNLDASSYTFTSDVGEFNERFEIHFTSTLSINESNLDQNQLIITKNDDVLNFTTAKQSIINNIQIFDLLGRLLLDADYKEVANSRTIKMNILKTSIIIVKVTLADGKVFTKKVMH